MTQPETLKPATRIVHAGGTVTRLPRTVGPVIQKGSTVLLGRAADLYDDSRPTYGRGGLATQEALAGALADLECAHGVRLFPSGLAALTGAMLAVLRTGDEVLVADSIYKPTRRFCDRVLQRFGVATRYYPPRTDPVALLGMATPKTRLIVMESPGSLTFEITDAPGVARLARERGILTLLDNTWAAGLLFQPLSHGIDLSAQALTKYVAGHSDVFMGSVAARDPKLVKALDQNIIDLGWAVAADDAYEVLRGLRTLPTRMARHQAGGLKVAAWLEAQPQVACVLYPALPSSPDHALWLRDFSGAAGVFSLVLRPCSQTAVNRFLDSLTLFGLGFSWGGFESLALAGDPQLIVRTHAENLGGPLIRLNIGLEDPDDLIADLRQGLHQL